MSCNCINCSPSSSHRVPRRAPPSPRRGEGNKWNFGLTKVDHALSGGHHMPDKWQLAKLVRHVHAVAHDKFVGA